MKIRVKFLIVFFIIFIIMSSCLTVENFAGRPSDYAGSSSSSGSETEAEEEDSANSEVVKAIKNITDNPSLGDASNTGIAKFAVTVIRIIQVLTSGICLIALTAIGIRYFTVYAAGIKDDKIRGMLRNMIFITIFVFGLDGFLQIVYTIIAGD